MVRDVDRLAIKIIILQHLAQVADTCRINSVAPGVVAHPSRATSLPQESCITRHLAFLCAYDSLPQHVFAVCIEEVASPPAMIIRLAANAGQHDEFLRGLRDVTQILENEARNGRPESGSGAWQSDPSQSRRTEHRHNNHESLFKAVVSLDRLRILGRLRSQHGRPRGKPPLTQRLEVARDQLVNSMDRDRLDALTHRISECKNQFARLEAMTTARARSETADPILASLIEDIRSILEQYEADFQAIPGDPATWSGNATASLLDRLHKVAHYVTLCTELLRAARRHRIFTNIRVEFVNLQRPQGPRLSLPSSVGIDDAIRQSCSPKTMARIAASCKTTVKGIQEKVKERLRERSRIHAELQILLYYELNRVDVLPRVICSSKSACYLCQLFLDSHGEYHTPSTHGRLYDTWSWPDLALVTGGQFSEATRQKFDLILSSLIAAVDQKISVKLASGGGQGVADPTESRVDIPLLTPSVRSQVSADTSTDSLDTIVQVVSSSCARSVPSSVLAPVTGDPAPATANGSTTPMTVARSHSPRVVSEDRSRGLEGLSPQDGRPLQKAFPPILIMQVGDVAQYRLDGGRSFKVHVPGIRVDVEHEWNEASHGGSQRIDSPRDARHRPLNLEIFCLSSSAGASDAGELGWVDVDDGDWEERQCAEGVLFSASGLLLKRKDKMLRLRVRVV